MKYERMISGIFIERPNRFIALVEINGQIEVCHVKNTGRCRELLKKGAQVFLQIADNPARKTKYDLISVMAHGQIVNIDSQIPNKVVADWLSTKSELFTRPVIRMEKTYGSSRFDLYVEDGERRAFIEVKGVTLNQEGIARFPDAPTQRGIKHLTELAECVKEGYEAYVFFVIQMKGIRHFEPNRDTHRAFAEALITASDAGVHVLAYDCLVTSDSIGIDEPVPVVLEE